MEGCMRNLTAVASGEMRLSGGGDREKASYMILDFLLNPLFFITSTGYCLVLKTSQLDKMISPDPCHSESL